MKKNELIEQLNAAKALSSQVDIDKVIALIKQIETPTTISSELGSEIVDRIERALDNNSSHLVDLDSAEFELSYDNRIELNRVDVNIYEIMEHVTEIVNEYVMEEEEENDIVELERGDEQMQNINQGLGLEPGGNPYAEQ